MSLRSKIADWISGGELSRANMLLTEWASQSSKSSIRIYDAKLEISALQADVKILERGLKEIIAIEKPTSNGTVKRMALLAKHTLDRFGENNPE